MEHWWWLRIRVQRPCTASAACAAPTGRTRRRLCLAASGVLLLPLAALAQGAEVIYEVRSQYQFITVQDTANGYRQLIFDGRFDGTDAIQSEMNLASPDELTLSYSQHIMAALPVVSRPRRVLVVGLGGACIQRSLHRLLPLPETPSARTELPHGVVHLMQPTPDLQADDLRAYGVSYALSPRRAEVPDQPPDGRWLGPWRLGPLGPAQRSRRVQCSGRASRLSPSHSRQEVSSCPSTSTGVETAVTTSRSC